ncbi:MAG: hypothetical protein ACI9I0_002453, partial [Rhodoferax sp.]
MNESTELLALARACAAQPGHFDELHGRALATSPKADQKLLLKPSEELHSEAAPTALTWTWDQFFAPIETQSAADLNQRAANLKRQIHDNGV